MASTYYSKFDMWNIVQTINQKLKQRPNESIKEVFGEIKIALSLKQPPNLVRLLSKKKQKKTWLPQIILKTVNSVDYLLNHATVSKLQIMLCGVLGVT